MKQNDHGGRGDDRESTVNPRCARHPPAVVRKPVLDSSNGPCPSMLTSAMCRRDDRQRPPNDRENSGDCARDSKHDHPKARPGSGLDVEVGDAHAKEAIGQARRSFQPGTPPDRGSATETGEVGLPGSVSVFGLAVDNLTGKDDGVRHAEKRCWS